MIAVNQSFVKRYWPQGDDPLGRRVRFGWEPIKDQQTPWLTIVGVVGDVRHSGLDDPPRPEIYVPYANKPGRAMTVVLETARLRSVGHFAALARETVLKLDADQPIWNVRTLDEILLRESAGFRAIAEILSAIAFGALGLAALGIYGVITWSVSQRRHEIGIRRAVGAGARDIVWLTLRQGMTPVGSGSRPGSRCRSGSASRYGACCSDRADRAADLPARCGRTARGGDRGEPAAGGAQRRDSTRWSCCATSRCGAAPGSRSVQVRLSRYVAIAAPSQRVQPAADCAGRERRSGEAEQEAQHQQPVGERAERPVAVDVEDRGDLHALREDAARVAVLVRALPRHHRLRAVARQSNRGSGLIAIV